MIHFPQEPRLEAGADLLTRRSLIERLATLPEERDWERFYNQYYRIILSFAQRQGLDEHAARDVLQETMLLLIRKLRGFTYQPERGKFRNWLLTLVAGKVRDAKRRVWGKWTVSMSDATAEGRPALEDTLAAESPEAGAALDRAWLQSLAEEAMRKVACDPCLAAQTFEIFQAYAIERRPVAEVAAQFRVKENAVYQIKNRLVRRLRKEVERLQRGGAPVLATSLTATYERT